MDYLVGTSCWVWILPSLASWPFKSTSLSHCIRGWKVTKQWTIAPTAIGAGWKNNSNDYAEGAKRVSVYSHHIYRATASRNVGTKKKKSLKVIREYPHVIIHRFLAGRSIWKVLWSILKFYFVSFPPQVLTFCCTSQFFPKKCQVHIVTLLLAGKALVCAPKLLHASWLSCVQLNLVETWNLTNMTSVDRASIPIVEIQ